MFEDHHCSTNEPHDHSESEPQRRRNKPPRDGNRVAAGQMRCSYCGQYFDRSESTAVPFCSMRCKQIDLGLWLNEAYGLPYEGDSTEARESFEND
jgi:endogenous inhibitor of DNA gyrase (YacG/DUF329 family)